MSIVEGDKGANVNISVIFIVVFFDETNQAMQM